MGREILVVRRNVLFSDGEFQGFISGDSADYIQIVLGNFEFRERDDVEQDSSWQQPIPYVWIVNPQAKKIFAYRRAPDEKYNESRLRNKWSCGVGGHVDKTTEINENLIVDAMIRELREEVVMSENVVPRIIGYINDDSNLVGKVHFGIVALAETSGEVSKGDDEMAYGRFYSVAELEEIFSSPENDIESWTEICWPFVKRYLQNLP